MKTLTHQDLDWQLHLAGIHPAAMVVKDELYRQIKKQWLGLNFGMSLDAHLKVAGLVKWDGERSDCDDYADEARLLMQRIHRKTPGSANTAAAFGVIRYFDQRPQVGWHWINVAICGKGEAVFYEPQTCSIRELSSDEIRSINAVYI